MVEEVVPTRKPLFGKKQAPIKTLKKQPRAMPQQSAPQAVPQQTKTPVKPSRSLKIIASIAIIVIAVVLIIAIFIMGSSYEQELAEKSSLLIPFLLKKK